MENSRNIGLRMMALTGLRRQASSVARASSSSRRSNDLQAKEKIFAESVAPGNFIQAKQAALSNPRKKRPASPAGLDMKTLPARLPGEFQ
ncbi:MAG: hypothetical protein DMG64_10670 [Acidobacteria bacterium]|nr:MAG: hypothetical protein DMG64_10670 [Acidobacteriota bacterium]